MKRRLPAIITALIIISITFSLIIPAWASGVNDTSYDYKGGFDHDAFLQVMGSEYKNRSVKSPDEDRAAALYIAEQFLQMELLDNNLKPVSEPDQYFTPFKTTAGGYNTQNVIAVKPASESPETAKSVIIGAHYDNVYDYEVTNPYSNSTFPTLSNGIYDNASGLAVMLGAANDLMDKQLDYNIYFVAFGAEEIGVEGSRHFVSSLTNSQKRDILLMVNIDSVAGGDYMYLFTQDWNVPHDSYLRGVAAELEVDVKSFPTDKKFMTDMLGERAYSHLGYLSDSYYFLQENINTAFFMSYNLHSGRRAAFSESEKHGNIMHTSDDYYEKLVEMYPLYNIKMQQATDIITSALTKDDFVQSMLYSSSASPDYSFILSGRNMMLIAAALGFVFIVFSVFYYYHISKDAKKKMEEFLNDPKQVEKINTLFKEFQNMNTGGNVFTYHPKTYKPKPGEKEFSVFGSDFEKKDTDSGDADNDTGSGDAGGKNSDDKYVGPDDIFKL